MAGPLATVAADVRHKLEGLRALTEDLMQLESSIAGTQRELDRLRDKIDGLVGIASSELINEMVRKLGAVRRASNAVHQHVVSKLSHTPHEYLISLSELAGYLDGKLEDAIHHFGEVERRNPSAMRQPERGKMVNVTLPTENYGSTRHTG